jgi:putative hydrolase of the HAD superfamily
MALPCATMTIPNRVAYDQCVPDESGSAAPETKLRAVVIDWGGVMTNPLAETVNAWIEADGIDRASYSKVMRAWVAQAYDLDGAMNPIHALERGECTNEEFEQLLAAEISLIGGGAVPAAGMLARMFAATVPDEGMHGMLRAVRRAGFRTALLSNSWGGLDYPRELFPGLFDVVVISGEQGMRKPEERIFRRATELLGLAPAECVFIDDIGANITAAEAIGMKGIHHRDVESTRARLSELLAVPLETLRA